MLHISGNVHFIGNAAGAQVHFIRKISIGIICGVQFAHQYFQNSHIRDQILGNMMRVKQQIQINDTIGLIIMPQIRNTCDGFFRIFIRLTGLLHILTGQQRNRLKLFFGRRLLFIFFQCFCLLHQFCNFCFA